MSAGSARLTPKQVASILGAMFPAPVVHWSRQPPNVRIVELRQGPTAKVWRYGFRRDGRVDHGPRRLSEAEVEAMMAKEFGPA
jgi:hypothetical protein